MSQLAAPRWDLSNVYPSLESVELQKDRERVNTLIDALESHLRDRVLPLDAASPPEQLAAVTGTMVDLQNELYTLAFTLRAYVMSFVSTDSYNKDAKRLLSEMDKPMVRTQSLSTRFEHWLGSIKEALPQALALEGSARAHAFILRESAEQARYLMSPPEEALAAELSTSGAHAWNKLQGTVTSQLSVDFELEGEVKKLPMPALINLHAHPDERVRRRAYETELQAWESVKEPLAACLNGVKGAVITLNERRGREDALHGAIDGARIDRPTLEAMLAAMHDSFPMFREYFRAKARRLGKESLPWWDVFAPAADTTRTFTFGEAREFVLSSFSRFSPSLTALAQRAFDQQWIDAEQRSGKRGGAFCMGVPAVKESRVLCNFDGSLNQVLTIAHELGHAYHNECAYQAGKTLLQSDTPMTMAETASIMCETIVTEAALAQAQDPQEKLSILESALIGDSQVIVDIYSRYLFEKEVFERRKVAELSAEELCEIMEKAQQATYGDGLDARHLHKYMWTWKPHYYYPGLSFYNFPYAFGLLFGLGLYDIYQQRGEAFMPDYEALLAGTGEASAADLAARFGINIRAKEFWEGSLNTIAGRVALYKSL